MSTLTLLSCNIHKGFAAGNRSFTLHRLGDALRSAGPDVAFLQEVQGEHRARANQRDNWIADQASWLAQRLDADHAYGANAHYSHGHHGNAILTRQPLLGWANHDVSNHRFERRGLLHARIQVHGRIVHLICCHLDLTRWGRDRQLERLTHLIRDEIPEQDPLVVAGDFNDWRGQAAIPGLTEAHLHHHGRHARTFPAWSPRLTLDRMYLRHALVREVGVLTHAPWPTLSDHIPLRCVVEIA
jgi:endonuclease/exonuclease/phosphatase family metal-dependent hydrolase